MPNIEVLIDTLTNDVIERRQSLDDALFALQSWFDHNVELMDDDERVSFSNKLNAEKDAAQRDGRPHGDDASLVASVLRLHIMRLLYRYDERHQPATHPLDDSPYERARRRLQSALRETEIAINVRSHRHGEPRFFRQKPDARPCLLIKMVRALDLELEQSDCPLVQFVAHDVLFGNIETPHIFERQIDTSPTGIFSHIAENVRQLESDAKLDCIGLGIFRS